MVGQQWAPEERMALWKSINKWCREHGVHQFSQYAFNKKQGAIEINAACYYQQVGPGVLRNVGMINSQIRTAIRGDRIGAKFHNKPIKDLWNRAEAMRAKLRDKIPVSEEEMYPLEAISLEEEDENETEADDRSQTIDEMTTGNAELWDNRESDGQQTAYMQRPSQQFVRQIADMPTEFGPESDEWGLNDDLLARDLEDYEREFVDPVYTEWLRRHSRHSVGDRN